MIEILDLGKQYLKKEINLTSIEKSSINYNTTLDFRKKEIKPFGLEVILIKK